MFLILDWSSFVQDIREQFPLNLDDTKEICLEHGLRHPSIQGSEQVMTSDFLIDTNDKKTSIRYSGKTIKRTHQRKNN
ncbi:Transposon Tn7 transposition protein TnsA [Acinetobacter baumannii]|nr:Transposon Tn7 transposition protein TnsA [Acinetobacter baumannii]